MDKILLGHGSGGRLMHQLIREHFAPQFDIKEFNDSAIIDISPPHPPLGKGGRRGVNNEAVSRCRLAFTTDSYVVSPLFFPGGSIGDLAVNGTINDLAVAGAEPLYLSAGFIIEEGFPFSDLKMILSSMAAAAKNAGIKIVAGDTKVVDKGKGDGMFINTSGIGIVSGGVSLGLHNIKAGDKVIISGFLGNHGISVMSERNGLVFNPPVLSDSAPLNGLVRLMLECDSSPSNEEGAGGIRMMRDPTRGGVATTLKEIAVESGCCITINENMLPISGGVKGACELLGLDPLYVANEGVLVAIVSPRTAESLVAGMKTHALGRNSAVIGEVANNELKNRGMVLLKTVIGGTRIVEMLSGEQLPRIC